MVWICYAELIMIGMYAVFVLHAQYGWPLPAAMLAGIAIVAALGAALHQFVIRPVLAAEPINQLLVTGGMLFLLQAVATLAFGIDFRNLGVRMQPIVLGEMSISAQETVDLSNEKQDSDRLQQWLEQLDPDDMGKYKM